MDKSVPAKFCSECGSSISMEDRFCTSCGNRLQVSDTVEDRQSPSNTDGSVSTDTHEPEVYPTSPPSSASCKPKKGYFEGIAAALFKENKNGKTIFFPWGILWGKGRVITDESTKTKVKTFVINYNRANLVIVIGISVLFGAVWLLLAAPLLGAWYHFSLKPLLLNCPYSEDKLTLKESFANSATKHNKFTLWIMTTCSVGFVVVGFFIISHAKYFDQIMIGAASIIFFGLSGVAGGYMLKVKYTKE